MIGGGVGGCSILYWLARLGWEDVVLVERADLTSGSTFHSAGLVGQLRSSLSLTRMMMDSVDLYRSLTDEVGLETGWREVGSLRLASSEERLEEIRRQAGWAKTFGLPLELVSAAEAQELFPPMSVEGVLGAAFLPTDGYIDPSQLTFALAEGARNAGATLIAGKGPSELRQHNDKSWSVSFDNGEVQKFDAVIGSVPSPIFARLAPQLPDDYREALLSLDYEAAVVVLLELDRSLSDVLRQTVDSERESARIVVREVGEAVAGGHQIGHSRRCFRKEPCRRTASLWWSGSPGSRYTFLRAEEASTRWLARPPHRCARRPSSP